jgi:acetoin utilization protein AcuB
MQVKDCMHTQPLTVSPDDLVSTALQRMRSHSIRHLPVVADGKTLVGIITDRDIRRAGASDEPHMAEYELHYLLEKMTVKDAMTTNTVTVTPDTAIAEAGHLFIERKFGCLPVLADDHSLQGILTVTDLLRAYVKQHEAARSS